jgi:hypothetical protein
MLQSLEKMKEDLLNHVLHILSGLPREPSDRHRNHAVISGVEFLPGALLPSIAASYQIFIGTSRAHG